MEGHAVEGDAVVAAVHPVHEGEEGDAAHEEGEQNHTSVGLVKTAVLVADLVGEDTGGGAEEQNNTLGNIF